MSVSFKKPQKKIFRKKLQDGGSDEETSLTTPNDSAELTKTPVPENVVPSPSANTSKIIDEALVGASVGTSSSAPKLSFDDDVGDTEGFKIKKSNRSRRLAKQRRDQELKENQSRRKEEDALSKMRGMSLIQKGSQMSQESVEIIGEDDLDETYANGYSYRPVALPSRSLFGNFIPDDKLVSEAKKRREDARKAGEEEYIALDDTDRFVDNKSRLIREDDNDLSDEDAEIVMNSQEGRFLGKREMEMENRRRNREFFEMDELIGQVREDSDEETQRWEEAQIRKGVSLPQIQALSEEINRPIRGPQLPYSTGYELRNDVSTAFPNTTMTTVDEIRNKIKNRMELAKDLERRHTNEWSKVNTDLTDCQNAIDSLDKELKSASFEYKFYQEMRGFVLDAIDCYNDKLPQINEAELKTVAAWRKGAKAAHELRRQFIKDQSDEIHGKNSVDTFTNLKEATERKTRLGEFSERRKKLASISGVSDSDFDLNEFELASGHFPVAASSLSTIFGDTVGEFQSLAAVIQHFNQWQTECSHSYNDAYIAHCLPKLVIPLIRYQLLESDWNPLKPNCPALSDMKWLQEILQHAFTVPTDKPIPPDDPNLRVIPMIVEDVVFSRLTSLLEIWDPLSRVQSERVEMFLKDAFSRFPLIVITRKPVQDLFRALVQRIKAAIEDDVFLPVYSQRILDSDPEACSFATHQFQSALQLFSNILLFHRILSNAALVNLAVDNLLNRCLLVTLRTSHNRAESVQRCIDIAAKIPDDLLMEKPPITVPKHLEMFCHVVQNLGKQNPQRDQVKHLIKVLHRVKDFKGEEVLVKQLQKDHS